MDFYFFQLINQFAGKNIYLDSLAIFFAEYFNYLVIFSLFLFLFVNFKKYFKMVIKALFAAIFARFVIVEIIRYFFPKPRPFVHNHINLLLNKTNELSFPSGHAAFFFALATVVYFYNKRIGILFFISAFLISVSRVFAGVHWPSDILVGAISGIISGWLVNKIFKKVRKNTLLENN